MRRIVPVVSVLVLAALLVAGPAAAQQTALTKLQKEVRHELVMLPYYSVFDFLAYQVQGDTVILMGAVSKPNLKSEAEKVVKSIEGVKNVVNKIEELPTSMNDDRIRRAVYRALYADDSPLFRYGVGAVNSIHIIVKNGNVSLEGVVNTDGDKTIAGMRANGVSGVFSVKNNLVVEK